jgi:hypothetical protein
LHRIAKPAAKREKHATKPVPKHVQNMAVKMENVMMPAKKPARKPETLIAKKANAAKQKKQKRLNCTA